MTEITQNEQTDWLSELSDEILEKIVGELDISNRMKIRKVSQKFRKFIDERSNKYEKIGMEIRDEMMILELDDLNIKYIKSDDGQCVLEWEEQNGGFSKSKKIKNSSFSTLPLQDLAIVMKKLLEVQRFVVNLAERTDHIDHSDPLYEEFLGTLKSISQNFAALIPVKSVEIHALNAGEISSILSCLAPGTLEKIEIKARRAGHIQDIFELEQWKQAKSVVVGGIGKTHIHSTELQNFLHFKRFNLHLASILTDDIVRIRDTLSKSANFEHCELTSGHRKTIAELGRAIGGIVTRRSMRQMVHCHPIPDSDSDEFLLFKIERSKITIEKKR